MSEIEPDSQDTDITEDRPTFGGGGRIYRDSRPQPEHEDNPEVPPWADRPEPPTPIRPKMTTVKPPEPEPEPPAPRNWREPISTVFEVIGMCGLAATGFLIALWLGILILSVCFILFGIMISREPVAPGMRRTKGAVGSAESNS